MDILSQINGFSSNQLLVAGVGTMLVAACAMRARAVAEGLRDLLAAQLYTTLTARTNGATVTGCRCCWHATAFTPPAGFKTEPACCLGYYT